MKLSKLKILFAAAIVGISADAAIAAKIEGVSAGNLKSALAEIDPTETTLAISGTINAADFSYIQDNFNNLRELDLSGAKIAKYAGSRLPYTGLTSSPEATLPAYSLTGLTTLTTLKLPSGLKSIGKGALSGTGITELTIPNSVEKIDDYAFLRCQNLTKINIPASVKSIGERAFAYCSKLSTVNIAENNSLPSIPEGTFEASGLKNLSLEALARCTEIGPWALAECNGLKTLLLPEKTQTIGSSALAGAKSIQTLSLPKSTDYIADNAMAGMSGLAAINAVEVSNVPYLGESVWRNVDQKNVTLVTADDMVEHFLEADQWKDFNIVSEIEDGIDEINDNKTDNPLRVRSEGSTLEVLTTEPIGRVSIFNVKGQLVAAQNSPKTSVTFSTSAWPGGVYLIVCGAGVAKISI